MQEEGLTRRNRIQVLKQHVYAKDPNVSLKALDQTWKLEGLYTEKHINLNINYAECAREVEEMDREIRELEKDLGMNSGNPMVTGIGSSPEEDSELTGGR